MISLVIKRRRHEPLFLDLFVCNLVATAVREAVTTEVKSDSNRSSRSSRCSSRQADNKIISFKFYVLDYPAAQWWVKLLFREFCGIVEL